MEILVVGCASARIAGPTCTATTLHRRRDDWIALGVMEEPVTLVLAAYDHLIGLKVVDLAVDGGMTVALCGGEVAGRTERRAAVVAFWLAFAAVVIIVCRLLREGWNRYRWDGRPARTP